MIDLRKEKRGSEPNPSPLADGTREVGVGRVDRNQLDASFHACLIEPFPVNSDLVIEDDGELERFNRLRTLVRSGRYLVDSTSLAEAILNSGDLG